MYSYPNLIQITRYKRRHIFNGQLNRISFISKREDRCDLYFPSCEIFYSLCKICHKKIPQNQYKKTTQICKKCNELNHKFPKTFINDKGEYKEPFINTFFIKNVNKTKIENKEINKRILEETYPYRYINKEVFL
jgi:hypothetical protein